MKSPAILFLAALLFALASANDKPTLPELVTGAGTYNVLVTLLQATGLLDTVVGAKGVTIFAPTDEAFGRTAKELGCKDVKMNEKVVDCLSGLLTTDQVKVVLTYHVVGGGAFDSSMVLKRSKFRTLAGKIFLRDNLELIDLSAGIQNPRLVPEAIDLKYDNGIVHTISRVLIPFNNLAPPCARIESPLPMANEKFTSLRQLRRKARSCRKLRAAIARCKITDVCSSPRGRRIVTRRITVGDLVGTATTCKRAARAVVSCK